MIHRLQSATEVSLWSWRRDSSYFAGCRGLGLLALVVLLLSLQGCAPHPPAFTDVLKAFTGESPTASKTPPPPAPPVTVLRLLVDCSAGMRGFVAAQPQTYRSNFVRIIETLSTRLPSAGYDTTWYCANSGKSPTPVSTSSLTQPARYESPRNSLGNLLGTFDELVPHSDKPSIDVIIGDWAAPENGESSSKRAAALEKMVVQKRHLLLWGFRSAYTGEYVTASSACAGGRLQFKQGQSLPGLGRPFYMLVSAPDANSLDKWAGNLSNELRPAAEYYWSRPPIGLKKFDVPKAKWLPVGVRSQSALQETKVSQFPKRVYSVFTVNGSKSFDITFTWTADLNMSNEPGQISAKATQISAWPQKDVEASDDLAVTVQASNDPRTGGRLSYTIKFPALKGSKWRVYRIPLSVGENKAPVPAWMSNWATGSDCGTGAANKTFNLTDAGDSFSEKFLRDRPFAEHYIAIRKE